MKKTRLIVILTAASLFSFSGFSYSNNTVTIKDKLLYCPSEIVCSETSQIQSCKFDSEFSEYWDLNTPFQQNIKGTYAFSGTYSRFHQSGLATCSYSMTYLGYQYGLYFYSKYEANLEAYYDKSTAWVIKDSAASCKINSPSSLCPFKQRSALPIRNNTSSIIVARANKIPITELTPKPENVEVIYDNALAGCGNSQLCKIDITTDKGGVFGAVTVDMDNKMKIVKIDVVRPSEVIINQIGSFNAVDVKYINLQN